MEVFRGLSAKGCGIAPGIGWKFPARTHFKQFQFFFKTVIGS